MLTFHSFDTVQDARDYRHNNGTGGWIFVADNAPANRHYTVPAIILFPPEMMPTAILHHPLTKGLSGNLLAN
jgi:hypothetical protein